MYILHIVYHLRPILKPRSIAIYVPITFQSYFIRALSDCWGTFDLTRPAAPQRNKHFGSARASSHHHSATHNASLYFTIKHIVRKSPAPQPIAKHQPRRQPMISSVDAVWSVVLTARADYTLAHVRLVPVWLLNWVRAINWWRGGEY